MPANTRPNCRREQIKQISTGQAGPQVNRDLEQIIDVLNAHSRCLSAISDFLNSQSSGSFADGQSSGGTSPATPGTTTGTESAQGQMTSPTRISSAGDFTLSQGISGLVMVEMTASGKYVSLPSPDTGAGVLTIMNVGATKAFGIKNDTGTVIGSLAVGGHSHIDVFEDASGVPSWPTSIIVIGKNGSIVTMGNITVDSTTNALYLKSPDGNYWAFAVDNTGALSSASTGTNVPPES